MTEPGRQLYIPIEISELLHSTLGPLADILERDGHNWSPMVKKVLDEYTRLRNGFLTHVHGHEIISEITHQTFLAAEKVCELTESAIREERDFMAWAQEVDGDSF